MTRENKVTAMVTVRVHNSIKEIGDLAGEFLNDFSNSLVSAESVVRNFSDSQICGKSQERNEIRDNRNCRLVYAAAFARALQGRGCRSVARL